MARNWPFPATVQANGTFGKNRCRTAARLRSWPTTTSVIFRSGRPTVRVSPTVAKIFEGETQLMIWSSQSRNEEPLTASSTAGKGVFDWSADGKWLLISQGNERHRRRAELWLVACGCRALMRKQRARKIISNPAYDLFQAHFSPDGRWIVFEAVRPRRPSRIHPLRDARCRRAVDSHHGWQALGRQASLVSRWKDDLLRFWPQRLLQRVGNPLRFNQRKASRRTLPCDVI